MTLPARMRTCNINKVKSLLKKDVIKRNYLININMLFTFFLNYHCMYFWVESRNSTLKISWGWLRQYARMGSSRGNSLTVNCTDMRFLSRVAIKSPLTDVNKCVLVLRNPKSLVLNWLDRELSSLGMNEHES